MKLTREQILKISGEAVVDPRTVANIYEGRSSKGIVRERVVEAAKKLGMPAPKETR